MKGLHLSAFDWCFRGRGGQPYRDGQRLIKYGRHIRVVVPYNTGVK